MPKKRINVTGSFSPKVKQQAMVCCRRHCCLCHKLCGTKIECHHIVPHEQGGPNTIDNCIPLCFDCHAEVQSYNDKHPRGTKFSPEELKQRRGIWYDRVKAWPASDKKINESQVDTATFSQLMKTLPSSGAIAMLRTKDFGNSFRWDHLKDLEDFKYDCAGPEHEFLDEELEHLRVKLRISIEKFLHFAAIYTVSLDHSDDIRQLPRELSDQLFSARQNEINEAADEVWADYDALIRKVRRLLA